jgi:MoxR-like ATPase
MTIEIAHVAALTEAVIREVERAVVGKQEVLKKIMAAFLADGGHVLLEDYPGLAKTLIANSFAAVLGLTFKRIQFTPDLLPGDITGGYIYDRTQNQFSLRKGPLFANLILADEINRASPRTQSALLEAMQEYQVTLEGCPKLNSIVSSSSSRSVIPRRRTSKKSCVGGASGSTMPLS